MLGVPFFTNYPQNNAILLISPQGTLVRQNDPASLTGRGRAIARALRMEALLVVSAGRFKAQRALHYFVNFNVNRTLY